jgi:predicted transcriptional regulator
VAAGLADAEVDRLIDHERVAKWLEAWSTQGEGEPPL